MSNEQMNELPLSVRGEAILVGVPALRRDASQQDDSPRNTGREALKGRLRPLVYFYLDKGGKNTSSLTTPESIVTTVASMPELGLEEQTREQLLEQYSIEKTGIDWDNEAQKILLDDGHPLKKISIRAKDQMSKPTREALLFKEL